ncbi:hypothetical protein SAMN05444274_1326, partial [Mariniphaga anaerophila]
PFVVQKWKRKEKSKLSILLFSYCCLFTLGYNGRVHVCEADSEEIFRPAGRRKSKRESAAGKPPNPLCNMHIVTARFCLYFLSILSSCKMLFWGCSTPTPSFSFSYFLFLVFLFCKKVNIWSFLLINCLSIFVLNLFIL